MLILYLMLSFIKLFSFDSDLSVKNPSPRFPRFAILTRLISSRINTILGIKSNSDDQPCSGESRECGHYICDVRESGQWYFYDDVNMHVIDLHYVRAQRKNSCYLFFYLKDDNLLES